MPLPAKRKNNSVVGPAIIPAVPIDFDHGGPLFYGERELFRRGFFGHQCVDLRESRPITVQNFKAILGLASQTTVNQIDKMERVAGIEPA